MRAEEQKKILKQSNWHLAKCCGNCLYKDSEWQGPSYTHHICKHKDMNNLVIGLCGVCNNFGPGITDMNYE
jgi:hypothetical protein